MASKSGQAEARALLARLKNDLDNKHFNQSIIEQTLARLKTLGRDANHVSTIYDQQGIETLGGYAFGNFPRSTTQEALRCIANALLLLPATRQHSLKLKLDQRAADSLQDVHEDEEFLLSRILFLLTYDPGIDINDLLINHGLAGSIIKNLAIHANTTENSTAAQMALMETLKLLFNATNIKTNHAAKFKPAVGELFRLLENISIPSPPLQPPVNLLLNALANLDIGSDQVEVPEMRSILPKLVLILGNVVQGLSATELDTAAVPLLTVLRKINESGPPEVRDLMKTRLLPHDDERDQPLGKSSSLASHLLRLTTSSGMVRLSEAISGLMFELSGRDANQYVQNVGYGYAAGYLMTHKIPIPESAKTEQSAGESSTQIPVNPVTGQRLDREPAVELPAMTREEEKREAERLFVLFEKLKATGVVDVKNPVEAARDAGRFEELSDSDE